MMNQKNTKSGCRSQLLRVLFFAICFITVNVFTAISQEKAKVSGVIVEESGTPVIGATVIEKGTSNGVVTDVNGNFKIELNNKKNPIVISYIGFQKEEVIYQGEALLHIRMKENSQEGKVA